MLKKWLALGAMVLVMVVAGVATADDAVPSCCICPQFVDVDGDGVCDLCEGCIPQGEDADGDGIPNGQDDDYVPEGDDCAPQGDDADGDGIPNGQDDDYTPPQGGGGAQKGK